MNEMRNDIERLLGMARAHGETSDTHGWVSDLEDMLRVAWGLMTVSQQEAFCTHPDILAVAEAAGISFDVDPAR